MATVYSILANLVAASHVAYVFFVLFGQIYIFLGWIFRWTSARNFWFRALHLAMMGIVVAETLLNIQCPLTTWEDELFRMAEIARTGVTDPSASVPVRREFIGDLLHSLIHFDLRFDHPIFTYSYLAFGALVLLSVIGYPPNWPTKSRISST